jgi:putative flavoprotein involved in K+ transport
MMLPEPIETLIIGGGQAGLTMSHMLGQRDLTHLVIERGRLAERWRSERWHGLRFQFPNWSVRLPDFPFTHPNSDGFVSSEEIVSFLEAYAEIVKPPLRYGLAATRLALATDSSGFLVETTKGSFTAKNVVVATGPYQRPIIPDLLEDCDELFQVHASAYKDPGQLPPGAVLVVGSGASGGQIAEELVLAGRKVYLAIGRHKRLPRRYRGRDVIWWLDEMGIDQTPVEKQESDSTLPLITGAHGGHTIDFRDFGHRGVVVLGRLKNGRHNKFSFANDLSELLAYGDAAYDAFLNMVDNYIEQEQLPFEVEPTARDRIPDPPCIASSLLEFDTQDIGLGSVIWSTGYEFDFGWIDIPVFDAQGSPQHDRGIAKPDGLYFLGLPWLSKMSSSFLSGVGDDASRLADHILSAT